MHSFKTTLQLLVRPMAVLAAARGISANQVTMAAMLGSLAVGGLLAAVGAWVPVVWWVLPAWMMARMALNAMDGIIARERGQATRRGMIFNELADVVSDAALILPLQVLPGVSSSLVVWVALFASWTELAGVLGMSFGASRRYEGPMGKADRALVLGLLGAYVGLFGTPPPAMSLLLLIALGLLLITVLRRVGHALAEVEGAA
ncbi:MAG: CDP-alcohol phosphatidyltransferase family protein [Alphaproteobacteria bacterium]|nr:CDP-alcohol phosphatidyltransferase family protein [Alphaproteobacteria bacterium]